MSSIPDYNNESEFVQPKTFRDTVSTVTRDGKRNWVYALKPSGFFYNWRSTLAWVYLALFIILPFVKVGNYPLFLFNILDSKFVLFGKPFWPQDFYILAFGMIIAIIFVVLFTIIYGRLFCGWVCPQTIFMEFVFRKIEWLIDGTPMQQRKLREAPWSARKAYKRILKATIFFALSYIIAHIFLSYILGVERIIQIVREPLSDHISLFMGILFFSFLFFSVFYFVREIVCTTICPYGRLQGVMFDANTMQVAYDFVRGEPRERFSKNRERSGGSCIDCYKCVEVCPTGIDIRNGPQLECVGCTACIDVCNTMMHKVGFEPNLIRFASTNNIEKNESFRFTPRVVSYSVLLVLLMVVMTALIATRSDIVATLNRVPGQLYQEVGTDSLSNYYTIKVINKMDQDIPFVFQVRNLRGYVKVVGDKPKILKKESVNEFYIWVYVPKSEVKRRITPFFVDILDSKGIQLDDVKSTFYGPF